MPRLTLAVAPPLLGLLGAACAAHAQAADSTRAPALAPGDSGRASVPVLAPGATVRVTTRDARGRRRESRPATFAGWEGDALVLRRQGWLADTVRTVVPVGQVTRLEMVVGRRERRTLVLRGARAGAIVGGTVGVGLVVLGALEDNQCDGGDYFCGNGFATIVGAVVGATTTVVTTAIGAVVGATRSTDVWDTIPFRTGTNDPSPTVTPLLGARHAGLSVRFR